MPANVTVVAGTTPVDVYLGNYTYASAIATGGMESLRVKLATDLNRLIYSNAARTFYKVMADASTTANHAAARVLFTDANGAAQTSGDFAFDATEKVLSVVGNFEASGVSQSQIVTATSQLNTHGSINILAKGDVGYTTIGLRNVAGASAVFDLYNLGTINVPLLTASQILETDGSKNIVSAAKGTAYNKSLGTTAGTVAEGNHAHSKLVASDGSPDPAIQVLANGDVDFHTATVALTTDEKTFFGVDDANTIMTFRKKSTATGGVEIAAISTSSNGNVLNLVGKITEDNGAPTVAISGEKKNASDGTTINVADTQQILSVRNYLSAVWRVVAKGTVLHAAEMAHDDGVADDDGAPYTGFADVCSVTTPISVAKKSIVRVAPTGETDDTFALSNPEAWQIVEVHNEDGVYDAYVLVDAAMYMASRIMCRTAKKFRYNPEISKWIPVE